VTSQAIGAQDWQDLILKINCMIVVRLYDRYRLRLGGHDGDATAEGKRQQNDLQYYTHD
jgi:hypothetical protein